jgi:hypothetical protein
MQSTLPFEEKHWSRKEYDWSPSALVAQVVSEVQETNSSTSISADDTKSTKKKKKDFSVMCQIEGCTNICETSYYRKYKICQEHGKSPAVSIKGEVVRFCQKCARFHSLVEFDDNRRSCRAMLLQHNRRRRLAKKSQKFQAEKQSRKQSLAKAILAESSIDSRGTSECKTVQIREKMVRDESSCQDTAGPHVVEAQEDQHVGDVNPRPGASRGNPDVEMVSPSALHTDREVCLEDCYQIANFFTSMPGNDTNMENPYMEARDRDILLSNEDLQIPNRTLEYDSRNTELRLSMKVSRSSSTRLHIRPSLNHLYFFSDARSMPVFKALKKCISMNNIFQCSFTMEGRRIFLARCSLISSVFFLVLQILKDTSDLGVHTSLCK